MIDMEGSTSELMLLGIFFPQNRWWNRMWMNPKSSCDHKCLWSQGVCCGFYSWGVGGIWSWFTGRRHHFFTALYYPLKWFLAVWLNLGRVMEGWPRQLCSVFLPEDRDLKHSQQSLCQHSPVCSHVMKS